MISVYLLLDCDKVWEDIFFFFYNFTIYKGRFDFKCKGKSIFFKTYNFMFFLLLFKNKSGLSLLS